MRYASMESLLGPKHMTSMSTHLSFNIVLIHVLKNMPILHRDAFHNVTLYYQGFLCKFSSSRYIFEM